MCSFAVKYLNTLAYMQAQDLFTRELLAQAMTYGGYMQLSEQLVAEHDPNLRRVPDPQRDAGHQGRRRLGGCQS